jgi:hypothetical protein
MPTMLHIDALLAFVLPLLVGFVARLLGQTRPAAVEERGVLFDTGSACRGSH